VNLAETQTNIKRAQSQRYRAGHSRSLLDCVDVYGRFKGGYSLQPPLLFCSVLPARWRVTVHWVPRCNDPMGTCPTLEVAETMHCGRAEDMVELGLCALLAFLWQALGGRFENVRNRAGKSRKAKPPNSKRVLRHIDVSIKEFPSLS
jgi:hypothetical protein